ncbi:hypothetical protein NDU88_008980 [Pleurodeles waltl]|uniref:Uncharacterized protein n=1 Tax=Pleurodeles waltl TaxID=8319 RepID=A0AAV7QTC0_PLEWA|nr:hypothetical protein NDU88_008980 [Pleurodeles waltl]
MGRCGQAGNVVGRVVRSSRYRYLHGGAIILEGEPNRTQRCVPGPPPATGSPRSSQRSRRTEDRGALRAALWWLRAKGRGPLKVSNAKEEQPPDWSPGGMPDSGGWLRYTLGAAVSKGMEG